MPLSNQEIFDEQRQIMTEALLKMNRLAQSTLGANTEYLDLTKMFIVGILSIAADLAEVQAKGASSWLYTEIEAAARQGGLRGIMKAGGEMYSLTDIAPDDLPMAMNYIGQHLSTTLFKTIHELPPSLRTLETILRGVETLLANLLNQKFPNPHSVLDSFCEHVHACLKDLEARACQ